VTGMAAAMRPPGRRPGAGERRGWARPPRPACSASSREPITSSSFMDPDRARRLTPPLLASAGAPLRSSPPVDPPTAVPRPRNLLLICRGLGHKRSPIPRLILRSHSRMLGLGEARADSLSRSRPWRRAIAGTSHAAPVAPPHRAAAPAGQNGGAVSALGPLLEWGCPGHDEPPIGDKSAAAAGSRCQALSHGPADQLGG